MKLINNRLYESAYKDNQLISKFEIKDYRLIANKIASQADIKIPKFTILRYEGNNEIDYLKLISDQLHPVQGEPMPVSINLCGEDLISSGIRNQKTDCGAHSVTVVGAYYKKGSCVIRIRNSYGKDWPSLSGDGHVTLKVDEFLAGIKRYAYSQNSISTFELTSLTKVTMPFLK